MMRKYRVLSMDGTSVSGGSGFVAMAMLRTIRRELRKNHKTAALLGKVDVFAGTSAGAINAVLFAMHDDPDVALEHGLDFWHGFLDVVKATATPMGREIRAVVGACALTSTSGIRDYFISHFGRHRRLGDLKKKVVIPAFQLDAEHARRRSWQPKIFDNFGADADLDALVVDVVMRSGSPPVLTPIYQGLEGKGPGYVDGGIYANNPSLVALAEVLNEMAGGQWQQGDQDDILLWSVGNGDAPTFVSAQMSNGTADWGFGRWLLNPHDPFALIYMMMESGVLMTDYQCERILRDQYLRLDPALPAALKVWGGDEMPAAVQSVLDLPGTAEDIRDTLTWLATSGWLEDEAPATGAGAVDASNRPT